MATVVKFHADILVEIDNLSYYQWLQYRRNGDGQIKKLSLHECTSSLSTIRDDIYVPYDAGIDWAIGSY
ncbi:hypothetical protein [Paenibacillus sp. Leaf72]|uniref:hypothetical protein n=1 Tax=Paenibacillus sp. Leaf72 TaxID=1736234 RepID=UPI0006FF2D2C|nr:hypothetical protein [Paenibacillus sp. Leaf72]KQN96201.1 hypothetical protein ASF12_25645 [Paenibacillus sp. Leaf72]